MVELLCTFRADTLLPDQLSMLTIVRQNTHKMLEMVNGILDVSRLESGRMPVNSTAFSLEDLVIEVFQVQNTLAHEKGICLENDVPVDLPPVWADMGLTRRVLQNLVGNAIKFTPPEGTIRVIGQVVESDGQSAIEVSVQDTGAGIPPEIQNRLFQKFVTGGQEGRGSGLGLAFCKLAVEAHGQRIWVNSEPGQGATFTFSLAANAL
jgi:signal transduction histidine kinase